jgi:hypothetical protein
MFTVVELEFEMSDVKQMKLERSLLQVVLHYVYSLVRPFVWRYQKRLSDDVILFDNGMKICDDFIPYEYMVSVSKDEIVRSNAL